MTHKTALIKRAARISLWGNGTLAALKIGAGIAAGSGALVGDGIDSSVDVLISIITLAVVRVVSRPADEDHPWGHGRAETVVTALISFLVFFAGAQLMLTSAASLIHGERPSAPSAIGLIAAGISIIGKLALSAAQFRLGVKAGSAMIIANGKNMAGDALISVGVLAGLGISILTGFGAADTIVALLVGAWVIRTAISIFIEANLELMDGGANKDSYRIVFSAVKAVEGAARPHRARMRRIAGFWDIDLDIEVDPRLTVEEAHRIASGVEAEIKRRLGTVFDVMIHIEPLGESSTEAYGLSEDFLKTPSP